MNVKIIYDVFYYGKNNLGIYKNKQKQIIQQKKYEYYLFFVIEIFQ